MIRICLWYTFWWFYCSVADRCGKKEKLTSRYIRPYTILQRVGPVAYKLELPSEVDNVHDTFHVSNLKKCLADAPVIIHVNDVKIDDKFQFIEEPLEIVLIRTLNVFVEVVPLSLKSFRILITVIAILGNVKISWKPSTLICSIDVSFNFEDEISFSGGECNNSRERFVFSFCSFCNYCI